MKFFQFFYRYIIRDLFRHRGRLLLTVGGIALGISVGVAVKLAVARAIGSFNDSIAALAGQADLEISGNGSPLAENMLRNLTWVWDYGSMTPVVEGRALSDREPV